MTQGPAAPRPAPTPISDDEIAQWATVPIFKGVDPDQLRWIVRKAERRHGIGELIEGEFFAAPPRGD